MRSNLSNWDTKQLSMAGSVTLVERVSLVDWDTNCQPRACRGLGLRHLVIGSEHPLKILKLLSVDEINGMKGIGHSASCQMCHHETKDLVHVLRDFPATEDAWMQIVPANQKGYKNVLIHMDSMEFVKALQVSCLVDSSSTLIRRIHLFLQTTVQWQIKCIPRERNKVVDRFAKVALDRNTEVKVFVNFPEEMLDEFRFCLKALSTPEVITAMDTTQLGTLIMKLGAANAKATLNLYNEIIKKTGSPQAFKALNMCVEAFKYAILSFEMVSSELVEDPQTANYDVAVIGPEIANCEKELINAKVQAPRLLAGNRFVKYYVSMGYEITSTLELENPNEY
ncbi:hypothetical protein Gotur_027898 [Gossypium turneri]